MNKYFYIIVFFLVINLNCDYNNPADTDVNLNSMAGELVLEPLNDNEIRLTWTKHTQAKHYVIQRGVLDTNAQSFFDIAIIPGDSIYYIDSGLSIDTTYVYKLYGKVDENRTNTITGQGKTEFPPIISLSLSYAGNKKIRIGWIHYGIGYGYEVEFKSDSAQGFILLADVPENGFEFVHENVSPIAPIDPYYYRVRAKSAYNYSVYIEASWSGIGIFGTLSDASMTEGSSLAREIIINENVGM